MLIWVVVATAVNIQIFRSYSINYTFIFEIDQNYKLIHHQLYRVGLMLFFIWFACMVYSIGMIEMHETNPIKLQISTILCLVTFIVICISPFHCFYRRTRKHIVKSLWNILISPFGLVRFRHFFLADVLTSIITPLQMTGIIYCFYLGEPQDWRVPQKPSHDKNTCRAANGYYIAMAFIPYWFRFM